MSACLHRTIKGTLLFGTVGCNNNKCCYLQSFLTSTKCGAQCCQKVLRDWKCATWGARSAALWTSPFLMSCSMLLQRVSWRFGSSGNWVGSPRLRQSGRFASSFRVDTNEFCNSLQVDQVVGAPGNSMEGPYDGPAWWASPSRELLLKGYTAHRNPQSLYLSPG